MRYLVTGAGGFIGHHMALRLKREGHWVRGVDLKRPEFGATPCDEFMRADLRLPQVALAAFNGTTFDRAFLFAADMGGMGYLTQHSASAMRSNGQINENCTSAAWQANVGRVFFSSSACVYPEHLQTEADVTPLKESDALPAWPDLAYGWEKLYQELRLAYYRDEYGLESRVARFHNIYGPLGTWDGGREKAPAAMCRKVALAKLGGTHEIEVWGDGEQTRSFLYIDDALDGILALMESDHAAPLNIGSDEMVSINALARLAAAAAHLDVKLVHVDGPQGVRGRNSDNTLCREVLGWSPRITLAEGMRRTYEWIEGQVRAREGDV